MPWKIDPRDGQYCVVKKDGGKVEACHPTKHKAERHMAALYANVHKDIVDIWLKEELDNIAVVEKQPNGQYRIVSVSTAALPDREDETFTVRAIDHDIEVSKETGIYPEYRLFHKKGLAVGRVEKMHRVGIFAVEEGHSYTDPFSIQVCEKMLANNDGTWRTSRGFRVFEVSGGCPSCGEVLSIGRKHMLAGYRCPSCGNIYVGYKGVLSDVHFQRAKTFDITITDIPAVPWTGVAAFGNTILSEDSLMTLTKQQIRKKLLDAGIEKQLVDERLDDLDDDRLKELGDDIPEATLLKELDLGEEDTVEYFVLDPDVLKEFEILNEKAVRAAVKEEVASQLSNLTIDVEGLSGMEVDLKEVPVLVEIKEMLEELRDSLTDVGVLKELLDNTSRSSRMRILRFKGGGGYDEDEEEEDEEMKAGKKGKKRMPATMRDEEEEDEEEEDEEKQFIPTSDGKPVSSMTEFVHGTD